MRLESTKKIWSYVQNILLCECVVENKFEKKKRSFDDLMETNWKIIFLWSFSTRNKSKNNNPTKWTLNIAVLFYNKWIIMCHCGKTHLWVSAKFWESNQFKSRCCHLSWSDIRVDLKKILFQRIESNCIHPYI